MAQYEFSQIDCLFDSVGLASLFDHKRRLFNDSPSLFDDQSCFLSVNVEGSDSITLFV
jgi:hypothetical protein